MLGIAAMETGQLDHAVLHFAELLAIAREVGHARGVAATLVHLGRVATKQGAYDRARSLLEEAVALNRAHDDHLNLAWSLLELGELERVQGHVDVATACLLESVTLYQEIKGAVSRIVTGLLRLAAVADATGHPERAVRLLGAVEAQRATLSGRFLYDDRIEQAQILERARARLGAERFTAAWEGGFASSLAEAIAEAASPLPAVAPAADPAPPGRTALTAREQEVLRLLVRGWSDKEIAASLGIGHRTVSNHVATIRDKLDAPSRAAAAAIAVRDHLV